MTGFKLLEARSPRDLGKSPYDQWLNEAGETVAQFHRAGGGFVVRFPYIADFEIETGDWSVRCIPEPDTDEQTVRDLYLNQISPLILSYRGELVLHASGVATPAGALGFVGASGRGKSTLATAFARQGHPFITDDGLLLASQKDGYFAQPNNPRVRLRDDSRHALLGNGQGAQDTSTSPKRHIPAGTQLPFQDKPVRLHALYVMKGDETEVTRIVPMKPAEALSALISHSFMLDVEDRQRMRRHFIRLAELAARQPCFALDFPRRYDYLTRVIADINSHAGNGDSP